MSELDRIQLPITVGETYATIARRGKDDTIVGKFSDGRYILFTRWHDQIEPGDIVFGTVVAAKKNCILMEPEEIYQRDDPNGILKVLNKVADSGHFQHAVIARGLLLIIQMLSQRNKVDNI